MFERWACMSLFEKMDPSFFTILVSKNRDIYVDLLLQIHDCIYRNQTMSMERALLQDLLEDYVQDKNMKSTFRRKRNTAISRMSCAVRRMFMTGISSFCYGCLRSIPGSMSICIWIR